MSSKSGSSLLTIAIVAVSFLAVATNNVPIAARCPASSTECANKQMYVCCDDYIENCTSCGLNDSIQPCCVKKKNE